MEQVWHSEGPSPALVFVLFQDLVVRCSSTCQDGYIIAHPSELVNDDLQLLLLLLRQPRDTHPGQFGTETARVPTSERTRGPDHLVH